MKGLVDTAVILKAVLDKENGLRDAKVLSHVALFEVPGFDRLLLLTDSAMNIAPDLETKKEILRNAVRVANALGNENPVVACLCAVEKVNPKMPATLDAAALTEAAKAGELKTAPSSARSRWTTPSASRPRRARASPTRTPDTLMCCSCRTSRPATSFTNPWSSSRTRRTRA